MAQVTKNGGIVTIDCTQEEYDILFEVLTTGGYNEKKVPRKYELQISLTKDMINLTSDRERAERVASREYNGD